MSRLLPIPLLLLLVACGLSDDERDDENTRNYLRFADSAFETCCLESCDANHDGRISRYEAQCVRTLVCSGRNIRDIHEIKEFSGLEKLDCSDNGLTSLDVRNCSALRVLVCNDNALVTLSLGGLRGLSSLDCSRNALPSLDLSSCASLATLRCSNNPLQSLDVAACSRTMSAVDARACSSMTAFYKSAGQQIAVLQLDDFGIVRER